MLNFRRLKKDFSPAIVKDGEAAFQEGMVDAVKIVELSGSTIRVAGRVQGAYENTYECEIEIDRQESTVIDSNCDCPYNFDCQHLAAVLFHLEKHLDAIIVDYGKETNLNNTSDKEGIEETIKEAETKEVARRSKQQQKELLDEYIGAARVLGRSPFFIPEEEIVVDKAELAVMFDLDPEIAANSKRKNVELQLALRLPYRSKPLNILDARQFLEAVHYNEPLYIGNKRYYFNPASFEVESAKLLEQVILFARFVDGSPRSILIDYEAFGTLLSEIHDLTIASKSGGLPATCDDEEDGSKTLPCLFNKVMEEPLRFSVVPAIIQIDFEYLEAPAPKLLLNPTLRLGDSVKMLEEVQLFECANPGLIEGSCYYRFDSAVKRKHLCDLDLLRTITIPEPLFGTLVENALPELTRFAIVHNHEAVEQFVTLPHVEAVTAECDISYLDGELEVMVNFMYGDVKIPAANKALKSGSVMQFITNQGILARNLTEEQKILEDLFQDFVYNPAQGTFLAKTEKKIVEFMTEVIPRNQHRVQFLCPENLLDQFIYDETTFSLQLKESSSISMYEVTINVDGHLNGIHLSTLWECLSAKKAFIELARKNRSGKKKRGKGAHSAPAHKILVLDLEQLAPIVQLFDEIGISELTDHTELRPLWSLANIEAKQFEELGVAFKMSKKLKEIQKQMLGDAAVAVSDVPKEIQAKLRSYQIDGANWLERLRRMHLNGILADDMGLGKTLQAITALQRNKLDSPESLSLVVCPTSLLYNWKEEVSKFAPNLSCRVIDGTPTQRKKQIEAIDLDGDDVIVTSYSLLQKDIDHYDAYTFAYTILDEAQHIKNRSTRNAKSVKMVNATHRLILTGTPIENSLDELWSLFDFLMPGLLSSYDRFVERFVRVPGDKKNAHMEQLKKKVSPFILRRMKQDVLKELPPVSEIVYHCHLSDTQRDLYRSYAASARKELSQLVKKEGFDKVQIHVLATLTRLKQICCHPAIFAKEYPELGDSSKYDMLMELLQTLIDGNHKTVIFSQYTRMLDIMSQDLKKQGIKYEYLDGSTKNRLDIVNRFNADKSISVFLVSLKAGGVGLNLVGADTVIHYDMWWNPAVESQATDRVHRIGQENNVSAYKLVTLGTIEEKIIELQNRKKGLVKKLVSTDEDAITKLTWEEVLELLQT